MKTRTKIRIAATTSRVVRTLRRCVGGGDIAEVQRKGIRWRLDLREGIDFSIYLLGSFEPVTVAACGRLIRPGDTVIDVGANIGGLTLPMARMVGPSGHVHAFEPTGYAFGKLQANLGLNPELRQRVTPVQAMLTDDRELVTEPIYSSWPLNGGDGLHGEHLGRRESTDGAVAVRLDDYVADAGLARVDFVKLDVDGFECHVLGGAGQVLRTHRPRILMELAPYCLTERGRSLDELLGLLHGAGYRLFHLDETRPVTSDSGALLQDIAVGASVNVVARAR